MKRLLLVGASPDVLEAKRVILERAGYLVQTRTGGGSVRRAAEEMEASLVVIDCSAGGPDVRAALEDMSSPKAPSDVPVLVMGAAQDDVLGDFDGPGAAIPKPAEKRRLLESARTLVEAGRRSWARRGGR